MILVDLRGHGKSDKPPAGYELDAMARDVVGVKHCFHCRFEDYYRRITCPLMILLGEGELETEREKEAMKGLSHLAKQAHIVALRGWVHPYRWLLDPEDAITAIADFLASTSD